MHQLMNLALRLLLFLSASLVRAQSIDLGRDEIPVTLPAGYSQEVPTPLIVLLHGYTSSGARVDANMGLSAIADDYGFLLVAPNGTREATDRENSFWNASLACCNFYQSDVDDSDYLLSVITEMQSRYNVDPKRIFLVGHSNGGFMTYRMAYDHAETIAAIVSLAGADHPERRTGPGAPVHVLQIHGTADATIAYRGGEIRENRYPGALTTVRRWAGYNRCDTRGRAREMRDLDASLPGYETGVLRFNIGCKAGGSAELWTISAGAHSPIYSDSYAEQVVEWLYAHPKPDTSAAD
ncbi:MAG: PHB depolymerase family esterase [Gammaproteobacteria bacterium]|nr:prolyl oligopeptidase family serine peptidase [Pseudomonadales bacterium]MCP5348025.1 prolyl oligopeptidase family serine peptidase [Pseudomonadales bacterium]